MAKIKEPMHIMTTIVDRGKGNLIRDLYVKEHLIYHVQCVGNGTAPTDMMEILELDDHEKDILFSIGSASVIGPILQKFNNTRVSKQIGSKGIVYEMKLTALNSLVAGVLGAHAQFHEKSEVNYMEQESGNSLIMITLNQGYTDAVMHTARQAGAAGGTILKGRWSGTEEMENFHGITIQEEREIIFILASDTVRNQIMDLVNKRHGLTSEANAVICSLPVERAIKLM